MTVYLSEVEVLAQFVDGLKKSAGCAHAMAHYQQNSHWLNIRDSLESVIEVGQRLAISKSMPRQELLDNLARREPPKDINGN